MSHHASGPNFGFPLGDARLDMTDLYAFPKPGQPDRSVLILNVHPSYAVNPLGPTTKESSSLTGPGGSSTAPATAAWICSL